MESQERDSGALTPESLPPHSSVRLELHDVLSFIETFCAYSRGSSMGVALMAPPWTDHFTLSEWKRLEATFQRIHGPRAVLLHPRLRQAHPDVIELEKRG